MTMVVGPPAPVSQTGEIPSEMLWRWSVAEYHRLISEGWLTDSVELLDGLLVRKMAKNPLHTLTNELARLALEGCLPSGWCVNAQQPVTTATSEPEPDLSVVRGDRRQYRERHPGPEDLALVVEVSDTTLDRDQGTKRRLYAAAGI